MCLPPAPAPASAAAKGRATYDAATSPTGYRRRQTSATPSVKAINAAIPPRCFVRDTRRSMGYALCSVVMTLSLGAAAYLTIPLRLAYAPLWALYAFANGTVATGCWVVAHPCETASVMKLLLATVEEVPPRRGGERAGEEAERAARYLEAWARHVAASVAPDLRVPPVLR